MGNDCATSAILGASQTDQRACPAMFFLLWKPVSYDGQKWPKNNHPFARTGELLFYDILAADVVDT